MAEYVELDLITDTTLLALAGQEYAEQAVPGLVYSPANIIRVMNESIAQLASEVLDQATEVAPAVYSRIGQTIYGITMLQPVSAASEAIFEFDEDTPPVMVPAETQVMTPSPSGDGVLVVTTRDILAGQGGSTVTVPVLAAEPGAYANGAFGVSELVDDIDGVASVVVSELTGGTDEESEEDYLDRLTDALTTLAPRPILPADHATLARQVPGVDRAMALDLYMPGREDRDQRGALGDFEKAEQSGELADTAQEDIPRSTTLAIKPVDGTEPSEDLLQRVYETLDSRREVNFLNFVVKPEVSVVDVRATVMAWPSTNAEDVQLSAETSVRNWLSPEQWGMTSQAGTATDWSPDRWIRLYEAVEYLNRADGVHYVEDVQIQGPSTSPWIETDFELTGIAPLVEAGDILITVKTPEGREVAPPLIPPDPSPTLTTTLTAAPVSAGSLSVKATGTVEGSVTLLAGDEVVFLWDDGLQTQFTATAGQRFESTHPYANPGDYTIGATITRGVSWGSQTFEVTV